MISLLSPAKSMDFSPKENSISNSIPEFLGDSDYLMQKLKKLSARQLGKIMHLNPQLADLNYERNQVWNKDFEGVDQKTAIQAFTGEVYRGLNASDFNQKELQFSNQHLLILSGLYGVIRPLDKIQPYRLEMGVKWKPTGKITNLYKFWDSKISEYLDKMLETHDDKSIVNLASNEYWKAVDRKNLKAKVVQCEFLDAKNGEYKAVMTWAKNARGAMAREIIKNRIDRVEDLKDVTFNSYSFNDRLSSDLNLVFTRD